ncbi:MAG: nucleotidyltransferase domain-containing protein [Kiritimatiellae bacterium]|nr:nucleotidyltransferase domain-containing protein [Kiritimatiellia bacterium]
MTTVAHSILFEHKGDLKSLCERFRVAKLYVFGSVVNGDFNEASSDIDFLAQFKEREPTADYAERFFGFEEGLVSVFKRPVDLITVEGLKKPGFRGVVERTRRLVYESGNTL